MNYKLNEEQLLQLVKNVYEEACNGYMDLKDSVCSRMIKDFLTDRKAMEQDPVPIPAVSPVIWQDVPALNPSSNVVISGASISGSYYISNGNIS